jgi:hypothetical protein
MREKLFKIFNSVAISNKFHRVDTDGKDCIFLNVNGEDKVLTIKFEMELLHPIFFNLTAGIGSIDYNGIIFELDAKEFVKLEHLYTTMSETLTENTLEMTLKYLSK